MYFPTTRLRRLRKSHGLRELVQETQVGLRDLIYPMFILPGSHVSEEIESMPGIFRQTVDKAIDEAREVRDLGIKAILLFGLPEHKDELGSEASDENGSVQSFIREIRKTASDLIVITDVCMCGYTSHGHCGIIKDNEVDNDETLTHLGHIALSHARSGADIVAPSDMMDGRVGAIREALDADGFKDIAIMSYSAKYASSFYGPFRSAVDSAPQFGDRRGYQMDPPNIREAMREINQDIEEGADIVMVKPALPYLDVIKAAREQFDYPLAAYNVSGEYSMVKAAAEKGWIDEDRIVMEILTSIKRAGADLILTYHAKHAARLIK